MLSHRYYQSQPPRCGRDATPLDGLDAVLMDGAEVGARHRAQVRQAAQRARSREGTQERVRAALLQDKDNA